MNGDLKEIETKIEKNVPLKKHTTFYIGGPALYFLKVESKEDLVKGIKWANENNLPFFVLGGGSNLLVSDEGYNGLVLKMEINDLKMKENGIYAEAGVKMKKLVGFCLKKGIETAEWAAGIPGTLGGAIRGNAAAFGGSAASMVKRVRFLDLRDLAVKEVDKNFCDFSYKTSIFKETSDLVILSALLKKENKEKEKGKIKGKIKSHMNYRKENHPLDSPSAGCIFKNVKGKIKNKEILRKYSQIKRFNKKGLIPSSYLLDKAGLKGESCGGAEISEKHANFIVNKDSASFEDVFSLIKKAKKTVKEKFGVNLKEEVEILSPCK